MPSAATFSLDLLVCVITITHPSHWETFRNKIVFACRIIEFGRRRVTFSLLRVGVEDSNFDLTRQTLASFLPVSHSKKRSRVYLSPQ